ncbi:neuroligin 4-like [Aplysia californica]|uniref:Neuroligin 4-like n=1 Tax=Aplysia californica TaxID=6500 RepID=A0ABM0ZVR4_APLCA|nr:neuroligin 4-like [Aplysia californica]
MEFGNECWQRIRNTSVLSRSEDCLYLNVFTTVPKASSSPQPVMVWIHGGGYTAGAASQYDVISLSTKGVVVVSINYRLNVFGFLSTEDDVMPGNYGMLDQIAALKWVRKNIAGFGGDPNLITIFGERAGSGSVSLLTLSPLAKGLFQRAIMESGVSISPWGIQHAGNRVSARTMSRLIGAAVECSDLDDSSKLLSCLQGVDANRLFRVYDRVNRAVDAGMTMCPRVETTFGFLPDLPITLLSRGQFNDVNTIRGFNSDERSSVAVPFSAAPARSAEQIVDKTIHAWLKQFSELDQATLFELVKSEYITDTSSEKNMLNGALNAQNDIVFVASTLTEINKVTQTASNGPKHYLYEYSHESSFSPNPQWNSATHGGEVAFVLDVQRGQPYSAGIIPTSEDILVSQQMIEMWTNFAKTGNPTSSVPIGGAMWSPYSPETPNYLFITSQTKQKMWQRPRVVDFYWAVLQKLDGSAPSAPADSIIR